MPRHMGDDCAEVESYIAIVANAPSSGQPALVERSRTTVLLNHTYSTYEFDRVFLGDPARNGLYRRTVRGPTEQVLAGNLACISALGIDDVDPDTLFLGSSAGASSKEAEGLLAESAYEIFDVVRRNQAREGAFSFNDAGSPIAAAPSAAQARRRRSGAPAPAQGMSVFVSFVEVDGDVAYDLLDGGYESGAKDIRNKDGAGYVKNAQRREARRPEDVLAMMQEGQAASNVDDSGAHRVVTIDVVQSSTGATISHGQLAFVFLASMEGGADPSLNGWRQCLTTLRRNSGRTQAPTRQSALTTLMQQYFGPDSKVVHISTITSVDAEAAEEVGDVVTFGTTTPQPDQYGGATTAPAPAPAPAAAAPARPPMQRQTRSKSALEKAKLMDIAAQAAHEQVSRRQSPAVERKKKGRRSAGAPGKTRSVADMWRQRERGEVHGANAAPAPRPAPSTPRTGATAVSAKKWWQVMSKTSAQPGTDMAREAANRARRKSGGAALPASSLYPSLDDASPSPPHPVASARKRRGASMRRHGHQQAQGYGGAEYDRNNGFEVDDINGNEEEAEAQEQEQPADEYIVIEDEVSDDDYIHITAPPRAQRRRVSLDEGEQRQYQRNVQLDAAPKQESRRRSRGHKAAAAAAAVAPSMAPPAAAHKTRRRSRGRQSLGSQAMPSPVAPPRSRRNKRRAAAAAAAGAGAGARTLSTQSATHHLGPGKYKAGSHALSHNMALFGERLGDSVQHCLDLRTRAETRQHALERLQDEDASLREEVNESHNRVAEESERLAQTRLVVERHRHQAQQIRDDLDDATEDHGTHMNRRDLQLVRKQDGAQQVADLEEKLDSQADQLEEARAELHQLETRTKQERAKFEKQRRAAEQKVQTLADLERDEEDRGNKLAAAIKQERLNGKIIKQQLDKIAELLCGPQKKNKKKLRESIAEAGFSLSSTDFNAADGNDVDKDDFLMSAAGLQSLLQEGKENAAAAAAAQASLAPVKEPKIKVLDHVRESFESPGGNFKYQWHRKSTVSTPKHKHFTGKKEPKHQEIRMHVQDSEGSHKIVTGKVQKSVTGKGSSCIFTDVESKEVGLELSSLIAKFDPSKSKSKTGGRKKQKRAPRL